jgi:hypothetical protein
MCSQRHLAVPRQGGERHHAVIVFAVVRYSRLMADDDRGTLNRRTVLYENVSSRH